MSFLFGGGSNAPFHKLLDKVTSEGLLETDWEGNLQIVDMVRVKDVSGKDAVKSITKRVMHKNPNVQLHALALLEMVVKNCGPPVHTEISGQQFLKDYKKLIETAPRMVKVKALECIQEWALAFKDTAAYRVVADTYNILRMEGYEFPEPSAEAAAGTLFTAKVMPEWENGSQCDICRQKFSLTVRRHHCRKCGKSFCQKCSSKSVPIPELGIEKPVRVCDYCYEELTGESVAGSAAAAASAGAASASTGAGAGAAGGSDVQEMLRQAAQNQALSPEEEVARAIARDSALASGKPPEASKSAAEKQKEAELKEREEMELAMALSMSEAEAQPKATARPEPVRHYYEDASAPQPSPAPTPAPAPAPAPASLYDAMLNEMETHEAEPAMGKYTSPSLASQQPRQPSPAPAPGTTAAPTAAPAATPALGPPEGEIDYSVADPLNNDADAANIKSVSSGLAVFELQLNRAATKGTGIAGNVQIQSLLRSLSLMHPDLLTRAEALREEKERLLGLKAKVDEIKAARQRYNDRCELHAHKLEQQRAEQALLEKVQLEQKMKLIEKQEHERLAALQASQQQMRAAMEQRQLQNDYEQRAGAQRLAAMQHAAGFPGAPQQFAAGSAVAPPAAVAGDPQLAALRQTEARMAGLAMSSTPPAAPSGHGGFQAPGSYAQPQFGSTPPAGLAAAAAGGANPFVQPGSMGYPGPAAPARARAPAPAPTGFPAATGFQPPAPGQYAPPQQPGAGQYAPQHPPAQWQQYAPQQPPAPGQYAPSPAPAPAPAAQPPATAAATASLISFE